MGERRAKRVLGGKLWREMIKVCVLEGDPVPKVKGALIRLAFPPQACSLPAPNQTFPGAERVKDPVTLGEAVFLEVLLPACKLGKKG